MKKIIWKIKKINNEAKTEKSKKVMWGRKKQTKRLKNKTAKTMVNFNQITLLITLNINLINTSVKNRDDQIGLKN